MSLMQVEGVTKRYGGFTALNDVTMTLSDAAPSMTAVAGESGSGKTTLARMMLGFIDPTEGRVLYRGKDVATMSGEEKRQFRREVQPIFQDPFEVFNPFYRIDHVLTTPVKRYNLADTDAKAHALIIDALERVGLRPQDTLGRFPHELSGGQRQRIMVARAVLLRPRMIVADEPVSMVDASLRATILDELRTLNRDLGISILYITHDLTTAFQICDNIVVLYRGNVAEAGAVERVIGDPKHPYSQLLVASIPLPDLDKTWGVDEIPVTEANAARSNPGCAFAPRCPHVMDRCWDNRPPQFVPDSQRLATCFLYDQAPIAPGTDVSDVFRPPELAPSGTAS
ncbi:ABC transporter ATP-binding protein [Devosia sp.]|uniref:ABC transporter ATP-binding protein n=1 Tax=Devosia sp. TaxID=1871048 RepID=UPI003A93B7CA